MKVDLDQDVCLATRIGALPNKEIRTYHISTSFWPVFSTAVWSPLQFWNPEQFQENGPSSGRGQLGLVSPVSMGMYLSKSRCVGVENNLDVERHVDLDEAVGFLICQKWRKTSML